MIRVCSGFAPSAKGVYGQRFLDTFNRYWPKSVELQVFVEEPTSMPRDAERSLWTIPGALQFNERHKDNLVAQGRQQRPGWKQSDVRNGYSFRFDALKFWKQILIPEAAAEGLEDGDILVWLDGDVVTTGPVPEMLVPKLLGESEVCFLGRSPKHSEIGFWGVRISERTRRFLHEIAEVYRSDRFLELSEWHSAFVWDTVRRGLDLAEHNLCPPGARGHVWPITPLARYTRHDKGKRKSR